MQKVLVTGVNGFVGQHLARELAAQGTSVIGVGGQQGTDGQSEAIRDYKLLDLLDARAAESIDFGDIDGVIHLAGLAPVGPSFDEPRRYLETNSGIQINLFEAALKQAAHPKFLIVSSGSLYDPQAPLPLTEASAVRPNSPYAVSKLTQEQLAAYYATRGFETVVARPFNHIGPGQNPGFIVPDLAQQVIAVERNEAKEVLVGNLDAKRDYTDVRDIVRAYRLLLERGKTGELYNICSGVALSGHVILAAILDAVGAKPTIKTDPARLRPSDTPELYGSYDKLRQDTGWQPEIKLATTMQDVVADWRAR
ncbi:MAG: GDP-mannose 4,6-dehydratase [Candidatus Saccharibacteria bacterium]